MAPAAGRAARRDNAWMRPPPARPAPAPAVPPPQAPLGDAEIAELEDLLADLPAPAQPLDASALDGYLCGVLLQPRPVPAADWLPRVADADGAPVPDSPAWLRIAALARRRHAELGRAIAERAWFDPWVFEVDEAGDDGPPPTPVQLAQPWVAGFSLALECFPALAALDDRALQEPLAVLFAMIDPEDLEDAGPLGPIIETLEPPATLAEAAEDLVRSVLLIADVTRPRGPGRAAPARRGPPRRPR
jgi:uncharacterized protein